MKKTILSLFIIIFFIGCSSREENIYVNDTNYTPTTSYKTTHTKKVKLKPYKVLGRWYYPRYVSVGEIFRGISSWYGPDFHGKLTANGEIYNMYDYTAANKIMPLGTVVKVTNLNNGKSVVVRINDRGPFVKERILDLSYAAGKKIGIDKTGTAPVEIVVLKTPYSDNKVEKISNKIVKQKQNVQKNGKIKIQIGAFKNLSGAEVFKNRFKTLKKLTYIQKIDDKYKVFIGNFNTYDEAKNFKINHDIKGFIVK
jgi:rare lipoprotein A